MAPSIHVDYAKPNHISKNPQKHPDTMMGKKTQGFSRGYSSGFVSDYRHAVDSMAESEGLGSSGRVEADSEDSSTPKRKCISLNVDRSDGFGVPVEVFSISKMSRSERKHLEMRLRTDLDRVRNLQKRITLRLSNAVPMSSSSDIRSSSDGKKGPFSDNLHRSLEYSSKQGNKKAPLVSNSNNLKRGLSGRFKSVKQENSGRFESVNHEKLPCFPVTKLMEQCEALLKRVMAHEYGWVFNKPVDVVTLNIPDYFDVIKHPMDLGTVKHRIAARQYADPWEFLADVRLTFSNAQTYNPPNNDVHIMAKTLSKYFEARWKNIQKKLPPINSMPMTAKSSASRESKGPIASSPSKKRKISSLAHENGTEPLVKTEPVKRTMTDVDKQNLTRDLESLLDELPTQIIDFLREHSCRDDQAAVEDELTVEIEALNDDILFTLRKLVNDYMQEKQRNTAEAVPCEEVLNESGVSNLFMQPCKGNELVDEDVDIGGNDPPASSYPPIEIEKDTTHVFSKCSSSSSSSSDSGSSSSDSDSDSGTDDENEASSPPVNNRMKETHATSHGNSHDENQSLSGLDQLEQNPETKPPISTEANGSRQEEENTRGETPVSPDKFYRQAVLKNRFADTILKAREKALLDQGDNVDPEKLRREREELERKKREEKARLQAEARAAEEARRKVEAEREAEAAAEAKRKRELEREAARLALQKMEKTVEINENCHFLESLEILGSSSVVDPHIPPLLADVTSPGPSPVLGPDDESDGIIGGFKLQGSNPLEQLGLYMKMDDEEEEEVEPK